MINVPLRGYGPDMDIVESLVSCDPLIKGIWCVPQYSNPTGETYSEDTVSRLASMYTAASDFKIFWDNAYFCHHLDNDQYKVKDILKECKRNNTSERPFLFTSTSKVTHAGFRRFCYMGE